jgi:FkbM family methyltransferase
VSDTVTIAAPENMRSDIEDVMSGVYDVRGLEFARPPRILDIGANVGAYAVWASTRWPGASITCFEPNAEACKWLVRNVRIDDIRPVAVRDAMVAKLGGCKLRQGLNNLGEASFYDLGEQTTESIEVQLLSVDDLPACDVLKVDTEGCELEIIGSYLLRMAKEGARLPMAVCFEFHRVADRQALDEILTEHGFLLVRGRIDCASLGTLCYARTQ